MPAHKAILLISVVLTALMAVPGLSPPGVYAQAAPQELACHVKGSIGVKFDPMHPTRVAKLTIGPKCEVSSSEEDVSPSFFDQLKGKSDSQRPDTDSVDNVNRAHTTVSFWHLGVRELSLSSYLTWFWDGYSVTGWCCGQASPDPAGCGWYVWDGPYQWEDDYGLPYYIQGWAWAYFKTTCDPGGLYGGWAEAMIQEWYSGTYNSHCEYDITLPNHSVAYCTVYFDY